MPPRNVQLTSNWPMAPDSKRISAIALSSSSIGWTSVSVWQRTSSGRLPLPTKLRMISMQWQPRSTIAPPPVSRPSQNHALWGPGCVSRERTQVTSPIAPPSTDRDGLERLGRVAQVLEVAAEHARPLDGLEHPARLLGVAPERLGAQDGLAGRRGEPRPPPRAGGWGAPTTTTSVSGCWMAAAHVGRRLRDAPASREGRAALLAPRVDDPDAVAAALAVQRIGVEVADEPRPEHRDRVRLHRRPFVVHVASWRWYRASGRPSPSRRSTPPVPLGARR